LQPIESSTFAIGPRAITARAFLAPMAGITDLPIRRVATRFGAGLVISEMIASEWLASGDPAASLRADGDGVGLHVVQLAGCEARWLAEGARIAAVIVPAGPIDWKALDAYARRQLEVRAPVRYYEAASLPRNAMGKLMREEITRLRTEGPDRILQRFPPAPAG